MLNLCPCTHRWLGMAHWMWLVCRHSVLFGKYLNLLKSKYLCFWPSVIWTKTIATQYLWFVFSSIILSIAICSDCCCFILSIEVSLIVIALFIDCNMLWLLLHYSIYCDTWLLLHYSIYCDVWLLLHYSIYCDVWLLLYCPDYYYDLWWSSVCTIFAIPALSFS